ncbi:MAG: hypothetical protein JXA13_12270 [Anaerolineales bacterium]|nr:hypothetical protein [Anaerolineales bacterium]
MEEEIGYQFLVSVREDILEIIISVELNQKTIDSLHAEVIQFINTTEARAVL